MADTLLTRPPNLTPEQVQQILAAGQDKTVNINGVDYGTVGLATNDEGGQSYTAQGITGYAPGTFNRANAPRAEYDLSGNFTRMGANMNGGSYNMADFADAIQAASFLYSFYAAGQGLGALMGTAGMEAGAAAGVDSVQGNSINVLDRATGVGYGSEPTFLTGPTSVNADYNILSSTYVPDPPNLLLDGNAGQGINVAAGSGTGLRMPTAPNLAEMGGGQGLLASGATSLGDPSSFINAPGYNVPDAGRQVVGQTGVYTPQNPYTPSLGDPASFVNGGTSGTLGGSSSSSWSMNDVVKGIQLGGQLAGLLGGGGSLGGGQASYSGGGVGGTADASNRAGLAPGSPAQGGAAGSIQGVANTLLTAKDQFGYGKSMLG